ncbi:hypothetical protein QLX08_007534 [Tetragonisca angustula]|uniref:Uncharacterized protein n=1 Tax=Tetragonisca angustula TaxID=166442 RepID=A0AAW0ZP94_9HYME
MARMTPEAGRQICWKSRDEKRSNVTTILTIVRSRDYRIIHGARIDVGYQRHDVPLETRRIRAHGQSERAHPRIKEATFISNDRAIRKPRFSPTEAPQALNFLCNP